MVPGNALVTLPGEPPALWKIVLPATALIWNTSDLTQSEITASCGACQLAGTLTMFRLFTPEAVTTAGVPPCVDERTTSTSLFLTGIVGSVVNAFCKPAAQPGGEFQSAVPPGVKTAPKAWPTPVPTASNPVMG